MKTFVLCLLLASALGAPPTRPRYGRGRNAIVGGTAAAPGEVPYQVSFQERNYDFDFLFCGGSIISNDWIVSAAHCVQHYYPSEVDKLMIVAGDTILSVKEGTEQTIFLESFVHHAGFVSWSCENDISLLKLSRPLVYDEFVQPVGLPEQAQQSFGDALVSGWGVTHAYGHDVSDLLMKVTVPIVSDEECQLDYINTDNTNKIYDSMICAGKTGKDSCQGDSGGPMVCSSGPTKYLCGITSFGDGCGDERYPGVYTEVSYFVDWIKNITGI